MSELDVYLQKYYLSAEAFASLCGISVTRLNELVALELVPAPSYVVTSVSTVRSRAFGEMAAPGSQPGAYFHPKNRPWVQLALVEQGTAFLKKRFSQNFALALADLNQTIWPLTDCFTETGEPIQSGLEARASAAWQHFLHGTFGLCVADPSTEGSIARKEVLQEKLTAITNNGADIPIERAARDDLRELIAQYASASMPFSPVEYPRSSRKRLVADLLERLANA